MYTELKKLIEANPLFREKLAFPSFKASRLRTLINQRLNSDPTLLLSRKKMNQMFDAFVFLFGQLELAAPAV